ncbi:putative methyltransferase [Streptomyces sp. Tu6071]|uniref:class I SAM-dependent methyltransferase n=1 Tax=Streptomyces sp. Tu6071 TaxID=355249 RepID=UPI00020E640F|nr:class I SAM-dependent methyltransferase [Streptomyces sp. Tu6071]EGJ76405.1 putative methyltransferase [Streptomyces sp. Tu6071]
MLRHIRTTEDVLTLLDGLFAASADRWSEDGSAWWDSFYGDADRAIPFRDAGPDEHLAAHLATGRLGTPGRALDLGCGTGRNAARLAAHGWEVDAVDLSATALATARTRVPATVRLHHGDAFTLPALSGPYDLVHDGGCFHHLPPHRRLSHLALLARVLRPGGLLTLTCFASGHPDSGSELPDAAFYRGEFAGSLHGGLAYPADALREIFATAPASLTCVELRPMRVPGPDEGLFGAEFLWAGLFRRAA